MAQTTWKENMNWWIHLSAFLLGLSGGIILGVVVDKDTFNKVYQRIKIKGRGHQLDHLLSYDEDYPDKISKRKARKLDRLKRKASKEGLDMIKK